MKVLIVGDSQAQGTPGLYAEQKFRALGHTVRRISQPSCGPIDWTDDTAHAGCRTAGLWSRYREALRSFAPDAVVLIYGSNDYGSGLDDALIRMKDATSAQVWMSGPPLYPAPDRQELGERIKVVNRRVFGSKWIDAYPHTPLSIPRDSLNAHLPGEGGRPWGEAITDAVLSAATGRPPSTGPGGGSTDSVSTPAWVYGIGAAMATFALAFVWRRSR